ncbi:MAG: radical SAM protein [Deltaproteobacteria bacterium]|nr:radical SAM protein [Deltaproteobacteria bacterium]
MVTEAISPRNIHQLKEILENCTLCPRKCGVNRRVGELGFCRLSDDVVMNRALAHYGEEPPISGTRGAGTLFLSSCNLKCIYCQNYQISHEVSGERMDSEGLSGVMLALQEKGCHNIEPVTPTPHIARIMEALLIARRRGLHLPLVYNCGGYENPEVLKLLEGMVDIYLPDFKYGSENDALVLSGAKDYPWYAVESIKEMVRQAGDSLWEDDGIAKRGILIRHLILPGFISNSLEVLRLIKTHISISVTLSIMSQYTPIPSVKNHPHLGRRITRVEYERVINHALDMGFENIFTQDVDDRALAPDFEQKEPFNWS